MPKRYPPTPTGYPSGVGEIRIGISGWAYDGWRGDFYPPGLPRARQLSYAAERMSTVEINGSFYALQRPSSYAAWRDQTPDDFRFAVKGGRYVTHLRQLRGVEVPLANFFASGVLELGRKLGPMLWQLPERLEYDAELLASFFRLLPRTMGDVAALALRHDGKVPEERAATGVPEGLADLRVRHALEFRHPSYCTDEALALLRDHEIACVVSESAGRWPLAEAVTSDLVYVRLHGDEELYTSGYSEAALDRWAEKCLRWTAEADVVVYFDNDSLGFAPHDALRLAERIATPR